jgi:FkbM family methyltransferase
MPATREANCRHGVFTYYADCRFLGASLRLYGEWSEDEVKLYDTLLTKDDVVVEIGANIGALTVPLSRRCKRVYAFEPQAENFLLLYHNLNRNQVLNVEAFKIAIGSENKEVSMPTLVELDADHGVVGDYGGPEVGFGSLRVQQRTLDDLRFSSRISFIKLDCEGSERDALEGAERTIKTDSPVLYVENNRPDKASALVKWLVDHGYTCFWHRPPVFRPDNYRNYQDNIFGPCDSPNMLCYPKGYEGPITANCVTGVVVV